MILRCTARLLKLLGDANHPRADAPPPDDDDWYGNLLWIDRRKCLLLVHAGTLFPIFAPDVRKADLRTLGPYVTDLVVEALVSEGLPADALGRTNLDVEVARTASRSILGHMNDMAYMCQAEVERTGGLAVTDIAGVNQRLRRGLHNRGGYVVPLELALKRATWHAS